MAENLFETALVVVESLQGFIVHRPDVHDDIARIQGCRVSRSDQVCSTRALISRREKPADVTNLQWHKLVFA